METDKATDAAFTILPMAEKNCAPVGRIKYLLLLLIQLNRPAGLVSEESKVVNPSDRIGLVDLPQESLLKVTGEHISQSLGDSSGKAARTLSRASG